MSKIFLKVKKCNASVQLFLSRLFDLLYLFRNEISDAMETIYDMNDKPLLKLSILGLKL